VSQKKKNTLLLGPSPLSAARIAGLRTLPLWIMDMISCFSARGGFTRMLLHDFDDYAVFPHTRVLTVQSPRSRNMSFA